MTITPTPSTRPQSAFYYFRLKPISKMPPTNDYSNMHTAHYTTVQAAYIDNVLQNAERLHMQQGEQLRELRRLMNEMILPGCVRGL